MLVEGHRGGMVVVGTYLVLSKDCDRCSRTHVTGGLYMSRWTRPTLHIVRVALGITYLEVGPLPVGVGGGGGG